MFFIGLFSFSWLIFVNFQSWNRKKVSRIGRKQTWWTYGVLFIYLTIMNALNYEEAVHKLLKIELQEGQEVRTIFFDFVL